MSCCTTVNPLRPPIDLSRQSETMKVNKQKNDWKSLQCLFNYSLIAVTAMRVIFCFFYKSHEIFHSILILVSQLKCPVMIFLKRTCGKNCFYFQIKKWLKYSKKINEICGTSVKFTSERYICNGVKINICHIEWSLTSMLAKNKHFAGSNECLSDLQRI